MKGVEESGKGSNDDTRLTVTSQQSLSDKTQEETKLVVASQKELNNDVREGAQLVVGHQKVLIEETQEKIELVAPFLKELIDSFQEGTQAVVASKPELSDDTHERTDIVVVLQEELYNNAQEETELVEASQKELLEDTQEDIEPVIASQNQPNNERQDVTELFGASQRGRSYEIQAGTELFVGSQEGIKLVVALQQELDVHTQEGPELVAALQKEQKNDSQWSSKLLVASQKEVVEDTEERIEQKAASQKELSTDLQEGSELVVDPQTEFIEDTKEGTEQVAASSKELSIDSGERAELGVALQQHLSDDTQETFQLVATSQKEYSNNLQAGAELVVAPPKELVEDTEDGTELVTASQKEVKDSTEEISGLRVVSQQKLNGYTDEGTELVAASQQEQNSDFQQGAELVKAPREEVSSDMQEGIGQVVASAKGLNSDTRQGTQRELSDDIQEGTELVTVSQKEPNSELVVVSHKELIDDTQEITKLMADSQQELKGDPQERPELVVTSVEELSKKCQEGTELVVSFPKEVIGDAQAATKLVVASEKENFQDSHQETELVAVSQKEPEEPRLTDRSEEATVVTTVVSVDISVPRKGSEVLSEQSVVDGNATEDLASRGRTMKWKDMARRKPHSSASTANEDRREIQPAVAKKSKHRRNLSKRAHSQEHAVPIRPPSSVTSDPIQQVPIPYSSPNIHNILQAQSSSSPALTPFPTISPHRQQRPRTQVNPLRFDELLQATNSVAWRPVVDCEPRGRLGSEFPPFSSGKPPRPPSQSFSRGVQRSLPSEFINPSIVQQNRQERPFHPLPYLNEANEATTQDVDLGGVNFPPPSCLQPETPPTSLSARGFESWPPVNRQSGGPSSLSVPELDPSEYTELPSPLLKKQKRNAGPTPQQKRRNLHKRRLQQLRTQVLKKLKLWGRESNLAQEADAVRQDNNDRKRLIMSEEQRETFVHNMVESSHKDHHMRATFLAAVRQIANLGVLHSSARLLMNSDPSGKSEDVFKASKQLSMEPEENSSATVHLYKSVDELHKQGEMAMRNLPPVDDSSMCSLGRTSGGAWELVFQNVGPHKRGRRQMDDTLDDTLDEPLRPPKRASQI